MSPVILREHQVKECLDLWTFQGKGFSPIEDVHDITKSEYFQPGQKVVDYGAKVADLAKRFAIPTPFAWCYAHEQTVKEKWIGMQKTHNLWRLKVDIVEVLAALDIVAWEHILGTACPTMSPPLSIRAKLNQKALKSLGPNDDGSERARRFAELRAEFWTQPPPSGGWYSKLRVKPAQNDLVTILVSLPFKAEWVIDVKESAGVFGSKGRI